MRAEHSAIALVFAGGIGTRMQAERPKQFLDVMGKPVLVHTLDHFQAHEAIGAIYLAGPEGHIGECEELAERFGVTKLRGITTGGASAQETIIKLMELALADGVPPDTVALIHDGVRPAITADLITQNVAATREHGSAITAIPCFETIASSVDGAETVDAVTDRSQMYVLQAPQSFRLGEAHAVNTQSVRDGLVGTFVDQAQLMKHYGKPLTMIRGFRGNVKLTTYIDFLQFRLLMESGEYEDLIGRE